MISRTARAPAVAVLSHRALALWLTHCVPQWAKDGVELGAGDVGASHLAIAVCVRVCVCMRACARACVALVVNVRE
jgi:hypothetical protein